MVEAVSQWRMAGSHGLLTNPPAQELGTTLNGSGHFSAGSLPGRSPLLVPPGCGDSVPRQKVFQAPEEKRGIFVGFRTGGEGLLPGPAAAPQLAVPSDGPAPTGLAALCPPPPVSALGLRWPTCCSPSPPELKGSRTEGRRQGADPWPAGVGVPEGGWCEGASLGLPEGSPVRWALRPGVAASWAARLPVALLLLPPPAHLPRWAPLLSL